MSISELITRLITNESISSLHSFLDSFTSISFPSIVRQVVFFSSADAQMLLNAIGLHVWCELQYSSSVQLLNNMYRTCLWKYTLLRLARR